MTSNEPAVVICRPPSFPFRREIHCPTCDTTRQFAGREAAWYGVTVTCLGCGDAWTNGEMHERPFARAWRAKAIAAAQRLWEEAGQYTEADYEQWRREEFAAAMGDGPEPDSRVEDVPTGGLL